MVPSVVRMGTQNVSNTIVADYKVLSYGILNASKLCLCGEQF